MKPASGNPPYKNIAPPISPPTPTSPGGLQGIREPFLLLGQVGNEGPDNGFLTLSKVLGLKLDAEMVALSAPAFLPAEGR